MQTKGSYKTFSRNIFNEISLCLWVDANNVVNRIFPRFFFNDKCKEFPPKGMYLLEIVIIGILKALNINLPEGIKDCNDLTSGMGSCLDGSLVEIS